MLVFDYRHFDFFSLKTAVSTTLAQFGCQRQTVFNFYRKIGLSIIQQPIYEIPTTSLLPLD
jgi:hypothetical protein